MSSLLEMDSVYLVVSSGIVLIFSIAWYWYCYQHPNTNACSKSASSTTQSFTTSTNTSGSSSSSSSSTRSTTTTTTTLKNVWDAPRNHNPSFLSSTKTKKAKGEKPFGSKYYYAHNNPNATGGYKDGLRMEDYTMNGPRLLSRNGKSVDSTISSNSTNDNDDVKEEEENEKSTMEKENENTKYKDNDQNATTILTTESTPTAINDRITIPITKYLWDDPGDSNGIATIRIDMLPTSTSTTNPQLVDWNMEWIKDVSANLAGEGLVVTIHAKMPVTTTMREMHYKLKIDKLYGDVAQVKTILKAKRLLIKLHKKKISVLSQAMSSLSSSNNSPATRKSNLEAWPQPHRKI